MDEQRRFFRHPTEIPIEVWHPNKLLCKYKRLHNVSQGGLAFRAKSFWEKGSMITVCIPFVHPPFEATGKVVWCSYDNELEEYSVGVEFMDQDDMFRAKMVEQICCIEQYRKKLLEEGRKVSTEEAALEWIKQNAANFADTHSDKAPDI